MSSNLTRSKKKRIKAVSQKVKVFRANEPLISVFMWGINHTVSELTHIAVPVMLMPDDFKASSKIKVDNHFFNKENLPSHYKIKNYCPIVFRKLREIFGVKESSYLESLTKYQPKYTDSSKSGSKFYVSHDKRLICKTLFSEEVMQMHQILKSYHQHVVERNGKTLLTQYLGMYRITVEGNETYIVVMRNIFGHKLIIHKKYDLKGSTVQRSASDKDKAKDIPTFKDNDFLNAGVKIYIGIEGKTKLMETLASDCAFMVKNNLMDYSLICGVHDLDKDKFIVAPSTCGFHVPSPNHAQHPLRARFDSEGDNDQIAVDSKNNLFRYNSARYSRNHGHNITSSGATINSPKYPNEKHSTTIDNTPSSSKLLKDLEDAKQTLNTTTTSTTDEFEDNTTDDQNRSSSLALNNSSGNASSRNYRTTTSGCFSTDDASGPESTKTNEAGLPLSPVRKDENYFYVSPSATLTITTSSKTADDYGSTEPNESDTITAGGDNLSTISATTTTTTTTTNNIPLNVKIRALIDPSIDVYAIPSSPELTNKPKIYFMAIIDLLTHYGMKKRTAHAAKTMKHGAEAEFTTVNPDQYAKRFLEFIEKSIE